MRGSGRDQPLTRTELLHQKNEYLEKSEGLLALLTLNIATEFFGLLAGFAEAIHRGAQFSLCLGQLIGDLCSSNPGCFCLPSISSSCPLGHGR